MADDEILSTVIASLAPRMLRQYHARIERAQALLARLEDDKRLLAVWESVTKKGCVFGTLTPEEADVVREAVEDEKAQRG